VHRPQTGRAKRKAIRAPPQDDEFHRFVLPVATRVGTLPHRDRGHGPGQRRLGTGRYRKESQILTSQAISPDPTLSPAVDPAPQFEMRGRESIVVLTNDASLAAAVRAVTAADHELFVVQAEADVATHLMGNAAGVVVLDTASVVSAIAQLTERLRAQFPDVVLIVAGGAYEQAALTAQVTSGAVYRFLHKPASEQRIRLFIDAAWRRRNAEHTGTMTTGTVRKLSEPIAPRRLALPLGIAALVVAAVAGIGGWLMGQRGTVAPPPPRHTAAPSAAAPVAPTDVLLTQLLARAAEASARGDLIMPVGSSASDLYRQALERHHGDPQAQAGLAKVVDQVLTAAEQDLIAQRLDEAEHMTLAARALQPDSVRVTFLTTQIARERERATHAQARLQLQQQQADELERQQKLIAAARTALTSGNLDETAHLIASAAAAGVARDAIDTLTRDLQGARLVAKMNETPAQAAPVPAIATPPAAPVQTAPAAAAPDALAHADDVVSASTLERLTYVEPEYPLLAREQGTSGWVDLAFNVQLDGSVNDVAVLASDPKNMFEHDAIAAVRKWRYRPAQRDGGPVVQRARLRIRFTVK
jgi:periplasmic protein TonB